MAGIEVRVNKVRTLTPGIKMFEFVAADGVLPRFDAGAHIDIETGVGLRRSYSLANDPKETGRYVTAILREEKSAGGSRWMHDEVREGDVLTVTEPSNQFPLAEDAAFHLLIAGGIGITPLLAMGYRLRDIGAAYHLYYCTRSPEQTAFLDEVKEVFGDRVTFIHDGGDVSKGIKLAEVLDNQPEGAHLYVCGPAGLINAARDAAGGWPRERVHYELFSSSRSDEQRAEIAALANEEFEIELAQSGVTLTVPADKTILDVLMEHGIPVMYTCEDGWCGNCQVAMLCGEADHRDEVLTEQEKEENRKIQVCISRAKPGEKLILDL
jgi:vanillate monooxygenase ferredoxin subunit